MPSLLDPTLVPGYKANNGPPEDYEAPGSTRWTANKATNNRFGVHKRADGRFQLRSLHRVRAMDLIGSSTVSPGTPYDTGESYQMHLYFENQRTLTQGSMPAAQGDVTINFQAVSLLLGTGRYVSVAINGQTVGQAFKYSGEAGGLSFDQIVIPQGIWNQLYGGDGEPVNVDFAFEPVDCFLLDSDWFSMRITYAGADEETRHFVNAEVAFPHLSPGIERRGDGRFQPIAIYQPNRDEEPRVARGVMWRIINDPADTQMRFWNPRLPLPEIPSEWPELGPSGRFCFVIGMETPDLMEGAFASYPVICGDPL